MDTSKDVNKSETKKGHFSHEYQKGKKIEDMTLKYFKDKLAMKIEDLSEDEEYQKKDIDFKGNDDFYEIKGDFSDVFTDEDGNVPEEMNVNIFFETNPNSTAMYCGKAWTQICEADYLLYNFVKYNKCLKIDWKAFKKGVLSELSKGNFFRMKHNVSYDFDNQMVFTYGYVINYKFFKKFIVEEYNIDFEEALKKPEKRELTF